MGETWAHDERSLTVGGLDGDRRQSSDRRPSRTGVAELATLVFLLAVLVFGLVEMGRAILSKVAVDDAIRHGATYAAISEEATVASIEATVYSTARGIDLASTPVLVACARDVTGPEPVTQIEVSVVYRQPLITPIASSILAPITIESSYVIERIVEGNPCTPD